MSPYAEDKMSQTLGTQVIFRTDSEMYMVSLVSSHIISSMVAFNTSLNLCYIRILMSLLCSSYHQKSRKRYYLLSLV